VRLQPEETGPFVESLRAVPKSGLHNPLKNPERCARPAARPAASAPGLAALSSQPPWRGKLTLRWLADAS